MSCWIIGRCHVVQSTGLALDVDESGDGKSAFIAESHTTVYGKVVCVDDAHAEYRDAYGCREICCSSIPGVDLGGYHNQKVLHAVLDRLVRDDLNVQNVRAALASRLAMDLSKGLIYDCVHREVGRVDMAERRRSGLKQFRGTWGVHELQLGRTRCCWR